MNKKFLLLVMCTFSSYAAQNQPIFRMETDTVISYSTTKASVIYNGSDETVIATFSKEDGMYSCTTSISSIMNGADLTTEESDAKEIFERLEFSWREQQTIESKRQTR